MITAPARMRCRPKNTADQSVLMAICKDQRPSAKELPGCIATRAAAHDINTYSTAHITGNSLSGGVQPGLSRSR